MSKYTCAITPERNSVIFDLMALYKAMNINSADNTKIEFNTPSDSVFKEFVDSNVYVNGVKFSELDISDSKRTMILNAAPYVCTIRCSMRSNVFKNGVLSMSVYINDVDEPTDTINIVFDDCDVYKIDNTKSEAYQLNNKLETFMLIRTNPKLTGNIKLVVDSEYKLYLDTFKVSSVLNDRCYRKYPISSRGNYPFDVKTVFSKLASTEIFATPSDALDPHKFFGDYNNQYITEYEYGAETNTDSLYSENMKILAPLHIGKSIPSFFCIFRYDGVTNKETYNSSDINDTEKYNTLIKDSSIVKIFDLRSYTSIGEYLNNYKNMLKDFLFGSVYMQFIEQSTEKYGVDYRQGNNAWRGIDIKKGVITNKMETSYFSNVVLNKENAVQETFDNFIGEGYERNGVLYPYIINLEFMFDDNEVEEYSMHRYFGLYLSANEFLNYECIIKDDDMGNGLVHKYDADDKEIYDTDIIKTIFNKKFDDKIFFAITNNDAMRIKNNDDVKKFIADYVLNNPDKNICNLKVDGVEWREDEKSFITLTFDEPIKYGEHLRFVYSNDKNSICLELVASNDVRLKSMDDYISPYVSTNEPIVHNCEENKNQVKNDIFRLSFYTQDVSDDSKPASISEQIERIKSCVEKFNSFIRVASNNESSVSFTALYENVYFQHIARLNEYDEPNYEKMYIRSNDKGKQLLYTSNENRHLDKDSYISTIVSAAKDILTASDKVLRSKNSYTIDDEFYTEGSVDRVVNYVEYDKCEIEDSIHYFTKSNVSMMHPLSPSSYYFYSNYATFSLFGYEILGWRWNNIVKFKSFSDYKNPYIVFDDIDAIIKNVRHPLVKSVEGTYETINKTNISNSYITDNPLVELGYDIHTQKIITTDESVNTVIYPYNVNETLVDFAVRPFVHNYQISLHTPESAALCVMGVYSIKDIDMSIDLEQKVSVNASHSLSVKKGEIFKIDSSDDMRIRKNTVYRVDKGAFNEFGCYKFVIIGDTVYYNRSSVDTVTSVIEMFNNRLTAASDMIISAADTNAYQLYDFVNSKPIQKSDNFFGKLDDMENSTLISSIVPQTNIIWSSNGVYFDGDSTLNIDKLVTSDYKQVGFLTEYTNSPSNDDGVKNMTINNSVNSYVLSDDKITTFRDLIKSGNVKNVIRKMLIQNNTIDTAIGYYNAHIQSLEFVYYGIKFIMKFDSNYYSQTLKLGEYNNFEVFIINDYDVTQNNEIYISSDEEIILFVNHKFDISNGNGLYRNLKHIEDGNIEPNAPYVVRKSPYNIVSNSICGMGDFFAAAKTSAETLKDNGATRSTFVQEDYADKDYDGNATILPFYMYFSKGGFYRGEGVPLSSLNTTVKDYNVYVKGTSNDVGVLKSEASIYSVEKFPYYNSSNTPNLTQQIHRVSESYIIDSFANSDRVIENVKNENILQEYINSFDNIFDCYVISNGKCDSFSMSSDYQPMQISLSIPNKTKYNYGYFMPTTYDIFVFDTNDEELGDAIGMSMLLGNTKISSVKRINSYSGNKIFSKNTKVEKNYFLMQNKSIFSSNWDANYYREYDDLKQTKYKYLNGYLPGVEDKSFFGSRCIAIHSDFIILDNFADAKTNGGVLKHVDSEYNTKTKNKKQCQFTINITQCIYSLFSSNSTFYANWDEFTMDVDTSVKNYIKNAIMNIFNDLRKYDITILAKPSKSKNMEIDYTQHSDYIDWYVVENINPIRSISDEHTLTVTMDEIENVTIHPQIKIYRK